MIPRNNGLVLYGMRSFPSFRSSFIFLVIRPFLLPDFEKIETDGLVKMKKEARSSAKSDEKLIGYESARGMSFI